MGCICLVDRTMLPITEYSGIVIRMIAFFSLATPPLLHCINVKTVSLPSCRRSSRSGGASMLTSPSSGSGCLSGWRPGPGLRGCEPLSSSSSSPLPPGAPGAAAVLGAAGGCCLLPSSPRELVGTRCFAAAGTGLGAAAGRPAASAGGLAAAAACPVAAGVAAFPP